MGISDTKSVSLNSILYVLLNRCSSGNLACAARCSTLFYCWTMSFKNLTSRPRQSLNSTTLRLAIRMIMSKKQSALYLMACLEHHLSACDLTRQTQTERIKVNVSVFFLTGPKTGV